MQYILMVYENKAEWAKLSKDQKNQIHTECTAWHEELVQSGHARSAAGLQPITTAATVREKNGQPLVTDGPFAETKEVLGGFEIIEAKDRAEALRIAQRMPSLRVGFAIEVRPLVTAPCWEE
jgi:hypothetical protein